MKEELVSFNTAKLAQEKGFEQKIGLGIKYGLGQYYNHKGVLNGDCSEYIKATIKKELDKIPMPYIVAAPTQSLLQRWLREEHGIHLESCLTMGMEYSFRIYKGLDDKGFTEVGKYEEALEAGLQEALKLIP